jgi:hypothetical protein
VVGWGVPPFQLRGPDGSGATISELTAAFRQGFVLEMVDTRTGEAPDGLPPVFVFVLNPVQYSLSEPFQAQITPGEDNNVVSEENGIIVREVTLSGTFGMSNKTATGFRGAQGFGRAQSGTKHFNDLRNFFRAYSAAKKDPARSATLRMLFHALRDDDHFVVIPKMFETPRDSAKTRTHHEYRITMSATNEVLASALQQDTSTDRASGIDNALGTVVGAFNDARAAIAEVTANLATYKRKVANISTVIIQASQMINAVGGFVSGATSAIAYPGQLATQVADAIDVAEDDMIGFGAAVPAMGDTEGARTLRRLSAAIDQIAQNGQLFAQQASTVADRFSGERSVTQSDVSQSGTSGTPGPGGATIGSRVRNVAGGTNAIAGLDIPTGGGFSSVTVQRTDTIESIAIRAGVSVEAVIILNSLVAPYIVPGGGPGYAKVGDTLIVPATGTGALGAGPQDYLTADEAIFGVDLAIDQRLYAASGTFDLVENSTLDDLALVGGIQNVVQGTEITVGIERGTEMVPELADIGIRRNVGVKGTIQHVLLASLTLREALMADPRVTGIASSSVVLDGDVLQQEITPIVGGSRAGAPFVLPFGSASSGA